MIWVWFFVVGLLSMAIGFIIGTWWTYDHSIQLPYDAGYTACLKVHAKALLAWREDRLKKKRLLSSTDHAYHSDFLILLTKGDDAE